MGGKVLRLKIDDVYEKGFKEGFKEGFDESIKEAELQSIEQLMKNTGWSAQKAMDALGVEKEKQADYLKKLS